MVALFITLEAGAGLEEGAGRRWRGGGRLGGVYHRADEQITVKDEACMHRPPSSAE